MLGEKQWKWLEEQLQVPAEFQLLRRAYSFFLQNMDGVLAKLSTGTSTTD